MAQGSTWFSVGYLEKDIQDVSQGYSKEHPIPRDRWPIYPTKYFFTKVRSLEKSFTIKKIKKIFFAQTMTFDLSKTDILENNRI